MTLDFETFLCCYNFWVTHDLIILFSGVYRKELSFKSI